MIIRFEENVSTENAQLVCQWSNSLGKSFQEQWMGTMIPFPLTIPSFARFGRNLSIFEGTRVCGAYPENQAKKTAIFILDAFYQSPETGTRHR